MKKILLSLGAVAAAATPVVTVISCGDDDSKTISPAQVKDEISSILNKTDEDKKNNAWTKDIKVLKVVKIDRTDLGEIEDGKKVEVHILGTISIIDNVPDGKIKFDSDNFDPMNDKVKKNMPELAPLIKEENVGKYIFVSVTSTSGKSKQEVLVWYKIVKQDGKLGFFTENVEEK